MLVELTEVQGPLDTEMGKVFINPRHVILVKRGVAATDSDKQAFVSVLHIEGMGPVRVAGSPTEVKQKLNVGGR